MRATLREITIAELRATAPELIRAHWEEVALAKDLMVLDPDWLTYQAIEQAGKLLTVGAFVDDDLAGYSVGLVTAHLHYQGLTYYQNDALFMAESHRRGEVGSKLIRYTEHLAGLRGAKMVCWHAKQGSALDQLMSRRGYAVQDIIYSRRL